MEYSKFVFGEDGSWNYKSLDEVPHGPSTVAENAKTGEMFLSKDNKWISITATETPFYRKLVECAKRMVPGVTDEDVEMVEMYNNSYGGGSLTPIQKQWSDIAYEEGVDSVALIGATNQELDLYCTLAGLK